MSALKQIHGQPGRVSEVASFSWTAHQNERQKRISSSARPGDLRRAAAMGRRRVSQRQRTDRVSAPLRAAGRGSSARIGSGRIRRLPVPGRSAIDSAGMPAALLRPTPRRVQRQRFRRHHADHRGGACRHRWLGWKRAPEARGHRGTARGVVRVRARADRRRRGRAAQAGRR